LTQPRGLRRWWWEHIVRAQSVPPLTCDHPAVCSGHTTAATFICGTLLFLLLPLALQAMDEQAATQAAAAARRQQPGPLRQAAAWLEQQRWRLWGAAAGVTATGRVLADAHWCSDTLAGACLGAALTSLTVLLAECLTAASGPCASEGGRRVD
jgi:hypothetical protein